MKAMKQLFSILLPLWPPMLLAAALGVLTVGSGVGLMGVAAFLLASAALHPSIGELSAAIAGVRLFGLSRAVLRYLERYLSHNATFRLLSRLRVWLYTQLEPLAPAGLEEYHSGQLLKRMVLDVDQLQFFYLRVLSPFMVALLILLAMAYWLSGFSMEAAWLLAAGFAVTGLLLPAVLQAGSKTMEQRISGSKEQLHTLLIDCVGGMSELSAFDRTGLYRERLAAANDRLTVLGRRRSHYFALADSCGGLGMNLTVWVLLVITIPLVGQGSVSGIQLAVLVLAVQSCFEAVLPLTVVPHYFQASLQAAKRLFLLTDKRPAAAFGNGIVPQHFSIEVKNLGFSYDGTTPVLDRVSFSLPVGKKLAIVGDNGAGKSTLFSLLLGFRPVRQGAICFNGIDIREFKPEDLRCRFGVVPQQTHIFHGSIRDNILLAKPEADEREFVSAAVNSGVDGFVRLLPQGYDTLVGENGHRLSGGQRQRLAIARALLKEAPVLLLDEPTAGLDAGAERGIMAVVETAMSGRTTLLITHRLLGLETMDEILVMKQGRVVERGTHQQLMAVKGLFYTLWKLQQEAVF
ncbi:MAG: thiol reductant ABC exporter subunit CydC [Veillonellales bacterium]